MTRDEAVQEGAAVKAPAERRLLYAILILMVAFMGIMVFAALGVYNAMKDSAERGTSLAQEVRAACADSTVDAEELGDLCDRADDVIEEAPDAAKGEKGDPGEPGEPGPPPTSAQVSLAVASYCAEERCDGRNATQAQVSQAVAMYCDDRGQCRGPVGNEGEDGVDGLNGEPGPPPSDAQVASAVAAYCSTRNNCQGQPGQDGSPGDVVTGGSCEFGGVGSLQITIMTATGPTVFDCTGIGVGPPPANPGDQGGGNG